MNTYCKMLSEYSFRGVIAQLLDHFVTPMYKMLFEQDPPYISKVAMETLIDIAYLYASPSGTIIWMYNIDNSSYILLNFSFDKLVM